MARSGRATLKPLILIVWGGFRLLLLLFVPLELRVLNNPGGLGLVFYSQSYYLQVIPGYLYPILFRWNLLQLPPSVLLGLFALSYILRLGMHDCTSFPRISALLASLVVAIVPIYLIIQFISVSSMEWSDIVLSAPVSVGYCSLLFAGLILMPSVAQLCNSLSTRVSNGVRRSWKDRILSPKTVSLLLLLCALLLPTVTLWQAAQPFPIPYTPLVLGGFLLQVEFAFYLGPSFDSITVFLQDPLTWRYYGVPIMVSSANLFFVWAVMRYALGKGSKRTAYITGIAAQIPSLVYSMYGPAYSPFSLILPFPATFLIGLILLQYVRAFEPSKEREKEKTREQEMRVPFMFVLRSRLSAWKRLSKHRTADNEESDENAR
ncbi:MAG: hypothetical protein ACFFH0_13145 [Promethearchaeota archaeon]